MQSLYSVDLPTLEEVLEFSPLNVLPDTLLIDAIAQLNLGSSNTSNFSTCILIVKEKKILGILTLRDIVRLIGARVDLSQSKISQVMTQPVITLTLAANQNALTALSVMRQHSIRHLPVVDDLGQLLGLITQDKIRQVIQPAHLLKLRYVTEVMVTEVVHVLPTTFVWELSQMMSDRRISCVIVVAQDQTELIPVGMITEKDIIKTQLQGIDIAQIPAQDVMSTPVFSISPTESLWTVHQLMQERKVRRLTVVGEQGQLQGLVTQTDLLRAIDSLEVVKIIEVLQAKVTEQTLQLTECNQQLEQEINQRRQVEESLRQAQQELELRVAERTAELTQANVLLQQREQQWQALFDHALDAIIIVDDEGHYIDVNPVACDLLGISREELLGGRIVDFTAPGFDFPQVWQKFCEQGQMFGKCNISRPDGTVRTTEFAAVANFMPHRHLSIIRDVSDRQQAEINLQNSEQRLQGILDNSSVPIYLIDSQNRHILVSKSYAKVVGTSSENLLGKSIYEFWPVEVADVFARQNQQVLASNQLIKLEETVPQQDGLHSYITVKFPLLDTDGKPYAVCGISTDITEQKQTEQTLHYQDLRNWHSDRWRQRTRP